MVDPQWDKLLTVRDRQLVVNLILKSNVLPQSPETRAAFLVMCGLDIFATYLPMNGSDKEFVWRLIYVAERHGILRTTKRHALGELLDFIRHDGATPPIIASQLESLIKKYSLEGRQDKGDRDQIKPDPKISPHIRRKVIAKFINLGPQGVEIYAYYFNVDFSQRPSDELYRVAIWLLNRIEQSGMFWDIVNLLESAAPNDFGTDTILDPTITGDVISGNKVSWVISTSSNEIIGGK